MISARLNALEERRTALLKILRSEDPVLLGTLYDTLRRCGNPTCRCARRPSHRQTLLVFVYRGRRRCRFVRDADKATLRTAADAYRAWRRALREFRALQNQENTLLKVQIRGRALEVK